MNKPTSLLLLFFVFTQTVFAQNSSVYRRYTPSNTTSGAQENGTAERPATYSTQSNQENRRSAALAKVHGKSASPAQYSTKSGDDPMAPVVYSTMPESGEAAPALDEPVTTFTVNGLNVQRNVKKGRGQVGNDLFTPVTELYYVQFAVYCKDTPVDKAPPIDGLYLLWHPGSTCPGGAQGASYIVKGYTSPEEAKEAVLAFKADKIDCWYNPALTGAEVEIIGVR